MLANSGLFGLPYSLDEQAASEKKSSEDYHIREKNANKINGNELPSLHFRGTP